jgi:hypothetical protein
VTDVSEALTAYMVRAAFQKTAIFGRKPTPDVVPAITLLTELFRQNVATAMEQGPASRADSHLTCQEMSRLL